MKVLSFDLFDTLAIRCVSKPKSIFYIIQKALCAEKKISSDLAENFCEERILAESISLINKEETSLRDIYRVIQERFSLSDLDIDCLVSLEKKTELGFIVPNEEIVKEFKIYKEQNLKLVIISDTYFDRDFINQILIKIGISIDQEDLFLSSEVGLTKRSGALFKHVISRFGLAPSQLEHIGDDYISDYINPRKIGITAVHYKGTELTKLEEKINFFHDLNLDIAVGCLRYLRIKTEKNADNYLTLQLNVAPMFFYTLWCLERALYLGIKRLYFVSRDGYVLLEIAKEIKKNREDFNDVELIYLYTSRKASYLGVFEITKEFLDLLWPDQETISLKKIYSLLGLTPPYDLKEDLFSKISFLKTIQADKVKYKDIYERIESLSKIVGLYYNQLGLYEKVPMGIVDIGWMGTTFKSIQKKIRNKNVHAFYFGFFSKELEMYKHNISIFYTNISNKREVFPALIEMLLPANHPTVISYEEHDGIVEPVFGESNESLFDVSIKDLYVEFANLYLKLNGSLNLKSTRTAIEVLTRSIDCEDILLAKALLSKKIKLGVMDEKTLKVYVKVLKLPDLISLGGFPHFEKLSFSISNPIVVFLFRNKLYLINQIRKSHLIMRAFRFFKKTIFNSRRL